MDNNTDKSTLSQEFKDYNRVMAHLNVFGSTLDDLNSEGYVITLTTKIWYLENRVAFSKKPQIIETENITARQYACYISSVGFFNDRVSMAHTPVGHIPIRLICYSPDASIKIERTFSVTEQKNEMTPTLKIK